jgi:hypothetical protein
MTFWLVLLLAGGSALHVGNYVSLASCQTAAKQAVEYIPPGPRPTAGISYNLVCVQAAESGANPPN